MDYMEIKMHEKEIKMPHIISTI